MSAESRSAIQMGTACRTMNPPYGLYLCGFPRKRPNAGVGMDLCARAAVFGSIGDEQPRAALVVLDTIGVAPGWRDEIRASAAAKIPGLAPEAVMVAATHTHSAPPLVTFGRDVPPERQLDPDYLAHVVRVAVSALVEAWGCRRDVHMRCGCAHSDLGHNRRVVGEDGRASNPWRYDGSQTGYFAPDVPFAVFEEVESGSISSVFVSFGCHPVTLGPDNYMVHPDYPGPLCRMLEAESGARTALFLTGGAGNINPKDCLRRELKAAERMGTALATTVLANLPGAAPCEAAPVVSASAPLEFRLTDESRERHKERAVQDDEGMKVVHDLQVIALGDLALVGTPGELFAEIGTAIRDASPFPHTIVLECANDILGYLSTDQAIQEEGYEPRRRISDSIEAPLVAAAEQAMKAARAAVDS